ncbi:endonuclease/exonuclease/phosphatase family protein [Thermodesulfobacteriota bacterium]
MRKLFTVIILTAMLAFAGCINVPEQNWIVSRRGNMDSAHAANECDTAPPLKNPVSIPMQVKALDPDGFSLLSWNILKGHRENWEADFKRFSNNKDLLVIQEAYLTDTLGDLLQGLAYDWDMAATFEYKGIRAGVLTASRIEPSFVCILHNREPLIRLPKTILVTQYPLSGQDQLLLLANVHLINFTLTASHFREQLQQLEQFLSRHPGPIIVSGDFNTWSDQRVEIVNRTADRLNLKSAIFKDDNRTTVLGHHVDHIYYRGLELIETASAAVTTSDHNPVTARFRLADTQ